MGDRNCSSAEFVLEGNTKKIVRELDCPHSWRCLTIRFHIPGRDTSLALPGPSTTWDFQGCACTICKSSYEDPLRRVVNAKGQQIGNTSKDDILFFSFGI